SLLTPLGHGVRWLGGAVGRLLTWAYASLLTPLGRGLVWSWVALWRYVVVPVVTYGLVVPVVWVYRSLLTPLGHGVGWLGGAVGWLLAWVCSRVLTPLGRALAWLLVWLAKALLVWPWVALWRYVVVPVVRYGLVVPVVWVYRSLLTPLGHGIAWLVTGAGRGALFVLRSLAVALGWLVLFLLVQPLSWIYRKVLAPVGREIGEAFVVGWRVAGYLSRALGRALAWLAWNLVGRPVRRAYLSVLTPMGHWLRDGVLRPAGRAALAAGRAAGDVLRAARATVRQARRDAWRVLVGRPLPPGPREPRRDLARTLSSTTTVPGEVPAPETSLRKQG
ncbi:hypothetical protein, partial [Streptomyces sp. 150FB]|uniref:hypothetical protein n=1 Tax=Streptomyces sp. 150FB TaxID=1576605 RepID=UPI0013649ABB